jgi:hypothetical protein
MAAREKMPDESKRRTVWFPDDLWERMTAAAKDDERTVSAWLRRLAEKTLK